MRQANSEQLKLFQRRRIGALLIEVFELVLAPTLAVAIFVALGEQGITPRLSAGAIFIVVVVLGQLARNAYFRCPACSSALPRGPRHVPIGSHFAVQCGHCGTRFER